MTIPKLFVLAEPRSGSSWLLETLNSHAKIHLGAEYFNHACYSEVLRFKNIKKEHFGMCSDYLENQFEKLNNVGYIGCKILLNQLVWIENDFPEHFIKKYDDAHFIFLTRKNALELQISLKIAHASQKWHTRNGEKIRKRRIKVNPQRLLSSLRRFQQVRNNYEELLNLYNVKQMHLDYETLFSDPRQSLERICDFMGLEEKDEAFRYSNETKGNPFKLEEIIENFDEIAEVLDAYPHYKEMLYQP